MSTRSAICTDLPTFYDHATYERAVEAVRARLGEVPGYVSQLRDAAREASGQPYLPQPVAAAMLEVTVQLEQIAGQVAATIEDLLQGAAAPVLLFGYAGTWIDIKGHVTDVQGRLRPDQLPVRSHWKGVAADRYTTAVTTQSTAAGRVGAAAGTAAATLVACAAAGLVFYVALGVILVRLIGGLIAAIAAFASEAFSWAGLLLALEEAGITTAMVIGLVTALTTLLGAQAGTMTALRGEVVDHSQFPDGHWPRSAADTYTDATVTDGDAKWSLTP